MKVQSYGYRKNDWNLGEVALNDAKIHLDRLIRLIAAIEHFERKNFSNSQDAKKFVMIPQLRMKHVHDADVSKRAAIRLRQTFNLLINETQL